MMPISPRTVAALLAISVMPGCSALSAIGDATTPLEVYELRAPSGIARSSGRALARDVIVEIPTTTGALETDRIMIRPNRLQAQYLPDVRWGEPTPVMVQTLILRSLEATGAVRFVGRKPLGPSGDYAILTEVIDFQAEVGDDPDTAVVRLNLVSRIVREEDASILSTRSFSSSAQAASLDTLDVVEAFDTASVALFPEHAAWVLSAIGAR